MFQKILYLSVWLLGILLAPSALSAVEHEPFSWYEKYYRETKTASRVSGDERVADVEKEIGFLELRVAKLKQLQLRTESSSQRYKTLQSQLQQTENSLYAMKGELSQIRASNVELSAEDHTRLKSKALELNQNLDRAVAE